MLATRSTLRENYIRSVLYPHSLSVLTAFLRRTYIHDSALYPNDLRFRQNCAFQVDMLRNVFIRLA